MWLEIQIHFTIFIGGSFHIFYNGYLLMNVLDCIYDFCDKGEGQIYTKVGFMDCNTNSFYSFAGGYSYLVQYLPDITQCV